MNDMKIFSIGKIMNNDETVCIKLDRKYSAGLKGLDGYSHIQVLWWADKCDNASDRNTLTEKKPYKKGPEEIGVFATHSPERPNPVAVSNVRIASVNVTDGVVGLEHEHILSGIIKCPLCGAGMTGTVYRRHNKKTDEYKDTFYYRCHHRKRADGKLCDFAPKLNQDKFNSEVEDVIRYMVREGRFRSGECEARERNFLCITYTREQPKS